MIFKHEIVGLLLFISMPGHVKPVPVQSAPVGNSTAASGLRFEPAWVPGPERRGTLILLFSCVLTLILCVWTTVHSNLEPELWDENEEDEGEDEGENKCKQGNQDTAIWSLATRMFQDKGEDKGRNKIGKRLDKNRAIWSVVTLLFPEITLCIAAHERRTAILLCDQVRHASGKKYHHWNTTLGYYAVMGGLVVKKTGDTNMRTVAVEESEKPGSGMDGDAINIHVQSEEPKLIPDRPVEEWQQGRRTLTPRGVLRLAKLGMLPQWIKPQTVKDKNKASILAKFLVCFQAIWIIVQVLGRYVEHLPVTLLELYTILHTMCAVAMYLIWMKKPFDIKQPSVIRLSPNDLEEFLKPSANYSKKTNVDIFWNHGYPHYLTQRAGLGKLLFRQLWHWEEYKKAETYLEGLYPILRAYVALWKGMKVFLVETIALSFVGFAYGGLHLLAWNYEFPTSQEHIIWQVASVWTAGTVCSFCLTIPCGYIGMIIWEKIDDTMEKNENAGSLGIKRAVPILDPGSVMTKISDFLLRTISGQFFPWFLYFFVIGFLLALIPAFLARLFLLVEAFVAMRRLPARSYDMVQWGNFMPHFG